MDCCLTNSDAHVTGGSEDGFIFFWDLVDASIMSSFRAHSSVVCFSFRGSLFLNMLMNSHDIAQSDSYLKLDSSSRAY